MLRSFKKVYVGFDLDSCYIFACLDETESCFVRSTTNQTNLFCSSSQVVVVLAVIIGIDVSWFHLS